MISISEGWVKVAGEWIWKAVKASPGAAWSGTKAAAPTVGLMYGPDAYNAITGKKTEAEAVEKETPIVVNHNYIQPEAKTPSAAGSISSALNHPDGLKYAAGAGLAGAAALGGLAALRARKQKEQVKKNAIT